MSELQRLTTQYVDTEDRVRLAGEDAQGNVQVLWLTHRLLARLAPPVCRHLAPDAGANTELISGFRQEAATSQLASQEPVAAPGSAAGHLITRVDAVPIEQGLRMTFFAELEQAATISFTELALRQWLAILRGQFLAAGWPEHPWPAWTDPSAAPEASTHQSLH